MNTKPLKATHRGYLKLVNNDIPCAVLENGKRIISQTGLFSAFERPRKGEVRQEGLPSIIGAKNLLPFVTDEIKEKAQPISYIHTNGNIAYGYDAELIPLVCELYLKASDAKVALESQEKIILVANIIVRSLAKIGITALIDEATGYQYDREKDELQKILAAYIAEDFLRWQMRFPRKFYQEIFRLYGWRYDPMSVKRSAYLGKFTNQYVYEQLPEGVLDELREKNPVTEKGTRKRHHHQHLTEDIGIKHLDRHLTKLITVMELSNSLSEFKRQFNRVFKNIDQQELPIPTAPHKK
ncbi:MAG: hypothetical protein QG603_527 [Patescibacteria group bacterium]|nr:hypothetical protein [Patescibacteria group bacterium]MDQ5970750.1 hypothetical protein [Patescibacteria group bacterium]